MELQASLRRCWRGHVYVLYTRHQLLWGGAPRAPFPNRGSIGSSHVQPLHRATGDGEREWRFSFSLICVCVCVWGCLFRAVKHLKDLPNQLLFRCGNGDSGKRKGKANSSGAILTDTVGFQPVLLLTCCAALDRSVSLSESSSRS